MSRPSPDEPAIVLRRVLDEGVASLAERMAKLREKKEPNAKEQREILALTKEAAPLLGHIRRHDQAIREATGGLTPAVVIAYLRDLEPERRAAILAELGVEDDGEHEGSVLS